MTHHVGSTQRKCRYNLTFKGGGRKYTGRQCAEPLSLSRGLSDLPWIHTAEARGFLYNRWRGVKDKVLFSLILVCPGCVILINKMTSSLHKSIYRPQWTRGVVYPTKRSLWMHHLHCRRRYVLYYVCLICPIVWNVSGCVICSRNASHTMQWSLSCGIFLLVSAVWMNK